MKSAQRTSIKPQKRYCMKDNECWKTTQTDKTNIETSNDATSTSNQNSSISEEVSSISRPSQSSPHSLNHSKLSENLMAEVGEIIDTPKKINAKIVSPTNNLQNLTKNQESY